MGTATDERPLSDLFRELSDEFDSLVRHEIRLIKVEMSQQATRAGRGAAYGTMGGALSFAAFLAVMAAAIMLLSESLPSWLATLIMGTAIGVIGIFLIQKGWNDIKEVSVVPRQTADTVKEDVQWIKREIR